MVFSVLNKSYTRQPRCGLGRYFGLTSVGLVIVGLFAACGQSSGPELDLSPGATQGQEVFNESGCSSCHGKDGAGGAGPKLQGVVGREETLDDGTVVLVDRDYLIRAISDPAGEKVEGYSVRMPSNDLDDEEIDAVIAYLEELK